MSFYPPGCDQPHRIMPGLQRMNAFGEFTGPRDALYKVLRDKRDSAVQAGTNESLSAVPCARCP